MVSQNIKYLHIYAHVNENKCTVYIYIYIYIYTTCIYIYYIYMYKDVCVLYIYDIMILLPSYHVVVGRRVLRGTAYHDGGGAQEACAPSLQAGADAF